MTRHSILHAASLFVAAIALVAQPPAFAGAQARRLATSDASDSVPRALAEALIDPTGMMRMLGGGRPRLVVGALPSALAQRLWVPPGSVILGGIESSGMNMAIIRSPMTEDSLKNGYRRQQLGLGWTTPQARPRTAIMGFVPAASASVIDDAAASVFCSGGSTLSIAVTTVDFTTREIRATALNVQDSRCVSSVAVRPMQPPNRPQYQTLVNPPGSGNGFAMPGCQLWNSSGGGGSTRLHTTMTVDDVFAYYGKQLADSGWTSTSADETVSRSWTRRDSTGMLVQITLTARMQPGAPGCIDVQMGVQGRR